MKKHKIFELVIISLSIFLCFLCRIPFLLKFGATIAETDSRFNWMCAQYIEKNGIRSFFDWFDDKTWYPQGRFIGETTFPGLMIICYLFQLFLSYFHILIDLSTICIYIGPIFSLFAPIFLYLLCKLLTRNRLTSILSAFYSSTNVILASCSFCGFFDNQSISITLIIIDLYLFLRPIINSNDQSTKKLYFMADIILMTIIYNFLSITTGEYIYVANIFALISTFSIFFGLFSINLYLTYSVWYIFSMLISSSLPCVSDKVLYSMTHLFPNFSFIFLQFYFLLNFLRKSLKFSRKSFNTIFLIFIIFIIVIIVLMLRMDYHSLLGRIIYVIFPFFSEKNKNFFYSVEEQNPASWSAFFVSFGPFLYLLPIGFYIIIKKREKSYFYLIFLTLPTFYFSAMMIRVLPIFSIYLIIIASVVIDDFLRKAFQSSLFDSFLSLFLIFCFCLLQIYHSIYFDFNPPYETSLLRNAEVEMSGNETKIVDSFDFVESLSWIENNTPKNAKIVSLWPHGYQILSHTKRTIFCDGNTNNLTHLNLVYLIYALDELESWKIARYLSADYIVVVFGGASGYVLDDLYYSSTFLKSLEIEYDNINMNDYFNSPFLTSENPTNASRNSIIFKLSYNNFVNWSLNKNLPKGFDIARGFKVGSLDFKLNYYEEVFTSTNWLFRVYKISNGHVWNKFY